MMFLRTTTLILIVIGCTPVQAQIYKWVDEQGHAQYSELPPQDHAYEVLNQALFRRQNAQSASQQLQDKIDRIEQGSQKTEQSQNKSPDTSENRIPTAAEIEASRVRNCEQAKLNLEILEKTDKPIQVDPEGNANPLNEQQRQEAVERNRQYIKSYCNP